MSGYMLGREQSYYTTKKPLPPVYLHFEPWRGIYNDKLAQAQGKMKYGFNLTDKAHSSTVGNMGMGIETKQSAETVDNIAQYKWLENIVNDRMVIDEDGNERMFIPQAEVLEYPEIVATGWSKTEVSHTLKELFNIVSIAKRIDGVMSKLLSNFSNPLFAAIKKHRRGALKQIIATKQSSLSFPNTGGIPVSGDTLRAPCGARR